MTHCIASSKCKAKTHAYSCPKYESTVVVSKEYRKRDWEKEVSKPIPVANLPEIIKKIEGMSNDMCFHPDTTQDQDGGCYICNGKKFAYNDVITYLKSLE